MHFAISGTWGPTDRPFVARHGRDVRESTSSAVCRPSVAPTVAGSVFAATCVRSLPIRADALRAKMVRSGFENTAPGAERTFI
jgi:hypothetical protein